MLKNSISKKIFLIMSCLFILFILYLFPKKEEITPLNETERNANQASIYLIDNNKYVSRVSVIIGAKEKLAKAREIISYLTRNSPNANYIKEGFAPILPKNTKVLSIDLNDDLLKINFSKEFYNITEENEDKMLSSLIFSLTSIEGINKISIYVEDSILNALPHSKKPLLPTLDRSYGINKTYDVTKVKGITNTTVYYLSKYKDYYYYVPVTMVNNEKKDKMEIIIKELTSKTMYQTNLISYLNNAKQINYELTDEYLLIKLNNELYRDLNDNHLMETVIYSINLSISENFDIKTVMYMNESLIFDTYFL